MSDSLCENFLSFFVDKTKMSRPQSLQTSHALSEITSRSVTWSVFYYISLQTCKDIIAYLKPTSCHYDFIPSRFLKQIVDAIGPDLLSFINICLSTGTVPDCLKHASVTPFLKKPNLDVSVLSNFRPISNPVYLKFFGKCCTHSTTVFSEFKFIIRNVSVRL